jgi:hypothetical protein
MNLSIQGVFYDPTFSEKKKKYARVHPNDAQMQAINPQMQAINAVHPGVDALNDAVQSNGTRIL